MSRTFYPLIYVCEDFRVVAKSNIETFFTHLLSVLKQVCSCWSMCRVVKVGHFVCLFILIELFIILCLGHF